MILLIFRLAPPTIITTDEIIRSADTIIAVFKMAENIDPYQPTASPKFNIIENPHVANKILQYRMEKFQKLQQNSLNENSNKARGESKVESNQEIDNKLLREFNNNNHLLGQSIMSPIDQIIQGNSITSEYKTYQQLSSLDQLNKSSSATNSQINHANDSSDDASKESNRTSSLWNILSDTKTQGADEESKTNKSGENLVQEMNNRI